MPLDQKRQTTQRIEVTNAETEDPNVEHLWRNTRLEGNFVVQSGEGLVVAEDRRLPLDAITSIRVREAGPIGFLAAGIASLAPVLGGLAWAIAVPAAAPMATAVVVGAGVLGLFLLGGFAVFRRATLTLETPTETLHARGPFRGDGEEVHRLAEDIRERRSEMVEGSLELAQIFDR